MIHTRSQWQAVHPDGNGPAPLPAEKVWAHHSVTAAPDVTATFDADARAVRTVEKIGQDRFGAGISYTFAITPSGRIFEGHSVDRRGTHTKGRNSKDRAICFVGNYDVDRLTRAQAESAAWLLAEGARRGWWKHPRFAGGHRDVPDAATACPGRFAHAQIGDINIRAAELAQPSPPATPVVEEEQTVVITPHPQDQDRLDVCIVGVDGAVWHAHGTASELPSVPWESLGGVVSSVSACWTGDGWRYVVTGKGSDGYLWSKVFTEGVGWGPWQRTETARIG